jgi:cell division transport system permease protein
MDEAVKQGPVIPPETSSLRTLTATMAVMCYLACLAIGALLLIDRAVNNWTQGLSREITVQVRDMTGTDVEIRLADARAIIEKTEGVASAKILDRAEGVKLLRPWLGDADLEHLPVPRLIRVVVDPKAPPDFVQLETTLKRAVQGIGLDTHQRWAAELTRMATTMSSLSWLILALIGVSAIAIVVFASRAVLEQNRAVVDILHLVGARDGYIARQFYQRFLVTGFIAGVIGLALAALTFLTIGWSGEPAVNAVAAASRSLLYAPDASNWMSYASLLAVPPAATLIALVTSRITLMQILGKLQ